MRQGKGIKWEIGDVRLLLRNNFISKPWDLKLEPILMDYL